MRSYWRHCDSYVDRQISRSSTVERKQLAWQSVHREEKDRKLK